MVWPNAATVKTAIPSRTGAILVVTTMVERQPFGNRTDHKLISEPMSKHGSAFEAERAIATGCAVSCP